MLDDGVKTAELVGELAGEGRVSLNALCSREEVKSSPKAKEKTVRLGECLGTGHVLVLDDGSATVGGVGARCWRGAVVEGGSGDQGRGPSFR
jgi:hypothetical protein